MFTPHKIGRDSMLFRRSQPNKKIFKVGLPFQQSNLIKPINKLPTPRIPVNILERSKN